MASGGKKMRSRGGPSSPSVSAPEVCPICCEVIIEASESSEGQEALFCDGTCQKWLHRWCAGVHKDAYPVLQSSGSPYHCPSCLAALHHEQIRSLSEMVEALRAEIRSLKAKSSMPASNSSGDTEGDTGNASVSHRSWAAVCAASTANKSASSKSAASENYDRKFNIVVQGIEECPAGSSRFSRQQSDMSKLASVLPLSESSLDLSSIKRLGKFKPDLKRPRPILVKFIRPGDAASVLSRKSSVSPPVYIKPDLSCEERIRQSVLLRERWKLIESGTSRSSIKVRNSSIFVDNVLHGSLTSDHKFVIVSIPPSVSASDSRSS